MTDWSEEELRKIAESDDLHVAPFRDDGVTYGTPTWIWSVVVGDALYARAYNGQNSRWYQAAVRHKGGQITAAGGTWDVAFEPIDQPLQEPLLGQIDSAYHAKYRGSAYLDAMIGRQARSATVKITPHNGGR